MFTRVTVHGLKKHRIKSQVYVHLLRTKVYSACVFLRGRRNVAHLCFQQMTLLAKSLHLLIGFSIAACPASQTWKICQSLVETPKLLGFDDLLVWNRRNFPLLKLIAERHVYELQLFSARSGPLAPDAAQPTCSRIFWHCSVPSSARVTTDFVITGGTSLKLIKDELPKSR